MTEINPLDLEKEYQICSEIKQRKELHVKYRSCLEEELKKNSMNVKALISLGVILWEPFHEEKKAIEYLEKAIQYDPNNVDARFWLAKCFFHDYCAYEKARQL